MRLLNTKDIIIESFPSPARPKIPDYVILSHRWRDQEISFQDIEHRKAGDSTADLEGIEGYDKILHCCREARNVGFEYVWIDTCCINKNDQVELTEALNSMFHWYRRAQVCYAYMSDVESDEDPLAEGSKFRESKWFTRGWTLQELVAPQYVIFFDRHWKEIGTKSSFQDLITKITGIPAQVLLTNSAGDISVAQRMSWAANRQTARTEDLAYCLLGLFNVNMPMVYGEGYNAFRRLQLEFMKVSDDQTIFAWSDSGGDRGLLARSPEDFRHCADVRRYGDSPAFAVTNKGINLKLPLIPQPDGTFLGVLSCQRKQGYVYPDRYPLGIYLSRPDEKYPSSYVRVHSSRIEEIREDVSSYERTEVYVREADPTGLDVSNWMQPESEYRFFFSIKQRGHALPEVEYTDLETGSFWDVKEDGSISLTYRGSGCNSILVFRSADQDRLFAVSLGVHNYSVWSAMHTSSHANIKKLAWEYWGGDLRMARWDNMDRRKLDLGEGDVARLAIRKGQRDGRRAYLIDIDASESFWLDKLGPGNFPGWWDSEENEATNIVPEFD
ncbi:hypothetical protein AYL99_07381 [Fonsecaea erecta]|uniref:Heterokaryon incompatibility domain-containing protein n=1 Tax=Fonsecaea erecta TaxID=1367422 RepID=A0A178ZFN0_9EURO|nr:hypothetical protein AYL99_07381 [Fonsecaea erecta]OAP58291.1 hypothetical protein AYL99_07381 [Fonsecaea erecta]